MASQTPNINLTLPTGAEKVSRQIINDNNTKIDTAIGTLNSKITQKNLGAFGNLSNIESALVTQLNSMATGEVQEIFFTTTASGISVFNVWAGYVGTIYKTDANRGVVSVIPHGTEPKTINGFYVNSAWTWESLYDKFAGTILPTNSNLLDAPIGVWHYLAATGLSNTPCTNGLVRVYEAASSGWKFIYVNDPTHPEYTYLNIKTGSGWSGWKKYTGASV